MNDKLSRLLSLVPWLQTHPGASMAEIAVAFGTDEAAIAADVDLLFCCGLPGGGPGDLIDFAFEGDGVTVLDPQLLDRPLRLDAPEAMALLVAVRALADVPGLTERDALHRVARKLEAAVGGVPEVVVEMGEADADVLATIRGALTGGRRLHLTYLGAHRDEVTERDVDPLRLAARDGQWYLDGWCHLAEAGRVFRVDRIERADLLDVAATPPPDAVPRDLADGLFVPSAQDARIELALDRDALWVADHYVCESVVARPDGGADVVLRTPDTDWVRRLLLRLGGAGRVTSPPELADAVRDSAERALAAYGIDGPS